MEQFHGTTIVAVRRDGKVAIGGDGQVTFGNTVMKATAKKIRRIHNDKVLVGFAGATSDAFTLLERFEGKLNEHQGNLTRAAIELAKDWRTDRVLRRLEAMLITADAETTLILTGNGDVLDPCDIKTAFPQPSSEKASSNLNEQKSNQEKNSVCAIGSGGAYAQAAAQALIENTLLSPPEIVEKSLIIAGDMCIYTNHHFVIETIPQTQLKSVKK